jgi:hypothetical protein
VDHEEQSFTASRLRTWCREGGWEVIGESHIGFVPFFFPALPARIIHALQPFLEAIPLLPRSLGAQIVLACRKPASQ